MSLLLLLLLLLFRLGPFCSFNSSKELLLVTAGKYKDLHLTNSFFRATNEMKREILYFSILFYFYSRDFITNYCDKKILAEIHNVPGGVLLAVVLLNSCLATELVLLCVGIGPKSSLLERRESPCESC